MKVEGLGEIIAERRLTLLRDNKQETVNILLGKRQNIPNHTDFYCPYQTKTPTTEKVMAVCGIDGFQAIQLALSTIGVELEVLQRDTRGHLIWDADDKGDLGFPVPDWKKE